MELALRPGQRRPDRGRRDPFAPLMRTTIGPPFGTDAPMVKLLHNPHSARSRRALGLVETRERAVEVIDVVEAAPEAGDLAALSEALPVDARTLLDHADALYFALGLDDPRWSTIEVLAAAFDNPRLLRCPILIAGDGVRLGDDAVADRAARNDDVTALTGHG